MLDNRSTGNSEPSDPATTAPSQVAEQATATSPSAAEAAIAALADRVATARGKLPLQSDPALFAELSEDEIAAERELAEWMRKQRRQQRRRAVTAELAAEKRDRGVALSVRRADDADARWHRRALAARRRVSNPDARLAQLYRRAEWSSRALIGVVVLGMLWAGVNVQHNLVPSGDMTDPLYWLSYGFEAMISIPIITIMVVATTAARWGREIARGKVVFLEVALLGVTIALNAGPHLVAGELARAAESAVAPVMVGVVIWLHSWVSARYAQLIDAIPVENDTTAPDRSPRRFTHTTVEFGEPHPFPEFTPEPTDSVALPIGHTARPVDDFDTYGTRFDPAAGLFATADPNAEFARPNAASPAGYTQHATAQDPSAAPVAPNGVTATSATPQQPPIPHGDNRTTAPQQPARDQAAVPAAAPQQPPAAATTVLPQSAPSEFPADYATSAPRNNGSTAVAPDPAPTPLAHNAIPDPTTTAPDVAAAALAASEQIANSAPARTEDSAADGPTAAPAPARTITETTARNETAPRPTAITPTADAPEPVESPRSETRAPADSAPTAATTDESQARPTSARPAEPAQHPAQRAAAMTEPAETARRAASTEQQGTQLALDEQAVAQAPVRRPRPRIVPVPEPQERVQDHRELSEAHDPWDDGDEIDPDSDETGVWAVAREISARRLSKLPVEQLAEVLTLADESWTPAAIGASIGLPGSRILGILEAARRLARPYAVSS
ncbi:hypothetical protein K7711_02290 [Nocardia sp. CA2R105]|uniref:hypothetical protein n=1 Tax=Nocardia coffeae TaxID=2873381 RepID=UPI001CA74C7B|nr:hypothetical protein [Nocardia coffeae]MBY8855302.1 hypothetical protein [Nocardia coffeae]